MSSARTDDTVIIRIERKLPDVFDETYTEGEFRIF